MPSIPKMLTPDQWKAVEHDAIKALLVGPAGSGKTEVLVRRLQTILDTSASTPFRVLFVTHRVEASQQILKRAEAAVPKQVWRLDVNTLHGFALEWLRRHGQALGGYHNVVVHSEMADRIRFVADFVLPLHVTDVQKDDISSTLREVLQALDDHRTLHLEPSFDCCSGIEFFGLALEMIHDTYVDALSAQDIIDLPGLLCTLRKLLRINPWVTRHFHRLFKHVLVDDAQYLTPIQAALLTDLVGEQVALFLTADSGLSITHLRGSGFEKAQQLAGKDPASSPLVLDHDFRRATAVLTAAHKLAEQMVAPIPEFVAGPGAPPGEARVQRFDNPSGQASGVVDWVRDCFEGLKPATLIVGEDPSLAHEDIAVIARAGWMLQPVVDRPRACQIPAVVRSDRRTLLPEPEVRIFIDALALVEKSTNRPARRRLDDELRALGLGGTEGLPLDEALRKSDISSLNRMADFIQEVGDGRELGEVISDLAAEASEIGCARSALVLEGQWEAYANRAPGAVRSLWGFLRHLDRVQHARPSDPGIRLLTAHKARVHKFRAVAVIDAREGAFPDHRSSSDPKLIDDERRSFYVAMTRAARSLLVSWPATTIDRWGRRSPSVAQPLHYRSGSSVGGRVPHQLIASRRSSGDAWVRMTPTDYCLRATRCGILRMTDDLYLLWNP